MIQLFTLIILGMTQPKPTLIYIGDPMCSWCYGVSEEMSQVKAHFENDVHFEIVMGGLRPYNQQTMPELKEFLTHHWEDVYKRSGQEFNYNILDDASITYDTEPPSRANVIIRKMAPEKSFDFFKATQKAFYAENKNMHLTESYHKALEDLDLDTAIFDKQFDSTMAKEEVKKDFNRAAEMGVRGFPSLILKVGDEYHVVANGYMKAGRMIQQIDELLGS